VVYSAESSLCSAKGQLVPLTATTLYLVHPVTAAGVLAGRADELALLDGLLRDLARGSANAVLIEGEPGIGKTALIRTALASTAYGASAGAHHGSQFGCQVFWGAGDELGQELPLHPFLDALRVRTPSANIRRTAIAGFLRGEVATDRGADVPALLAEQLIALTIDETAARPVALVIDDLHWADPASVRLWGRLARTAGQVPLLLIGITRPVPHREDLLVLRRSLDDEQRVSLTSLSQPAVAELVGALAGGRPDTGLLELAAGAAGNPLYLTELLAALARSAGVTVDPAGNARLAARTVPDSLPGVIADRLGFVSASTRKGLPAAALLGVDFAIGDLTAVLGRTVADLVPAFDESRSTGVLTDSVKGLAFRHPLIRESLYAEMPTSVRAAWHRDAGHALAAAGAPPERVARQLLRGTADGGPGWMMDWLAASADSLVGQAPGVAAELLARAVDSIPAGSATHGWLAGRLAAALYRTGDLAAAERVAERALGHAADPDLIVDLHWTLTQCRMRSGSADESFAALDRALGTPGLSARHRARLLGLGARTYLYLGDVDAAGREAGRALAAAAEADDTWATGWALNVLAGRATVQGKLVEALPLYDQGLAVTETDPALTDLGLLLINKAVTLCNLNRYDEALAVAERARQLADQVGTAIRLAQAHGVLGQLFLETGRWDDALAEIETVPTDLKEPGAACGELGTLAVISFHRNEAADARAQLCATEPHAGRFGP